MKKVFGFVISTFGLGIFLAFLPFACLIHGLYEGMHIFLNALDRIIDYGNSFYY